MWGSLEQQMSPKTLLAQLVTQSVPRSNLGTGWCCLKIYDTDTNREGH